MSLLLVNADSLQIPLADKSVHMCVTSPPYFSLRDYGVAGQIGLEKSADEFVEKLVSVFREVWRVMRDDGTLWLNLGDSYNGSSGSGGATLKQMSNAGSYHEAGVRRVEGLKPKDLIGIPWRVAFALQAEGWFLRSEITWCKKAPMPESVTDRPANATEKVFLFAKSSRYFYDSEAVRVPASAGWNGSSFTDERDFAAKPNLGTGKRTERPTRNLWNYWILGPDPYPGSHYATFPRALVEPCIKAGTSEAGCCPTCGKSWERVIESQSSWQERKANGAGSGSKSFGHNTEHGQGMSHDLSSTRRSIGFRQSCACPPADPVPCVVLDPFAGSGTTPQVARQLGRHAIGLDLSYAYLHDQARARLELDKLDAWTNGVKDDGVLDNLPLFVQQGAAAPAD